MSDPRADTLRAGYATVARAYCDQLIDELAGKPLGATRSPAVPGRAPKFADLPPRSKIILGMQKIDIAVLQAAHRG